MCDDLRIDERVIGIAVAIDRALEAVIRMVHDADRRDGRTVRRKRREREERLLQKMRRPLRRIRRTAAADCKDHVRLADLRDPRQRLCIFKSRVIPVLEAAEKLDLPFDRLADQRLRRRSRLLTAHNDRRLAIVQADIRDGIICIDPDREMREKCTFHRSSFLYTHR